MYKCITRGLGLALVSLVAAQAHAEDTRPPAPTRTAVDAALKRGDARAITLTEAAPTMPASTQLRVGASGAPVDAKNTQLGAIGGATAAQAGTSAGSARSIDAPKSVETAGRAPEKPHRRHGTAPKVQDAQRPVIEAMNARFAACLTEADADVDGTAVLNAWITPTGEVTSAAVLAPGGVSPKATACFRDVVAHAKFAPVAQASIVQIRVAPSELRDPPAPPQPAVADPPAPPQPAVAQK